MDEGLFESPPGPPLNVGDAVIAQTIWGDEAGLVSAIETGIVTIRTKAGEVSLGVARVVRVCGEAELRAGMSDDEFWTHVLSSLAPGDERYVDPNPVDELDEREVQLNAEPCPLCGETGACGYDMSGRPMIHTTVGEKICEECGNDLACEASARCLECMENLDAATDERYGD